MQRREERKYVWECKKDRCWAYQKKARDRNLCGRAEKKVLSLVFRYGQMLL
jgi:hypothetical protein